MHAARIPLRPWRHLPFKVLALWLCSLSVGMAAATLSDARHGTANPSDLADAVLQLVQEGYDEPDQALRALHALAYATPRTDRAGPSAGVATPATLATDMERRRWVLLGQGLVLAGAGRSIDSWTVATALRNLSDAHTATRLPAALAQADAQLVQAVLADTQGQTQQVTPLAQSALDGYRSACGGPGPGPGPAAPGCDHRTAWRALLLLARHSSMQGHFSAALEHALAAAELAGAAGDTGHQAWALALAADQSSLLGESDQAQRQFAQARRLARLYGSARIKARLAVYDSRMRARSDDLSGARRAAEAGLLLAGQASSPRLQAVLLANLSDIHVKSHRPQAALAAVERALPAVHRHGDLRVERVLLANAGLARIGLGQRAAARRTLDELLAAFAAAGAGADRATVLREFADALAAAGDLKGALELYHQERQLAEELTAANRQAAMAELQARYDRSAQQRRLEQLARDNSLIDAQLANRQSLQRLWALGAVVLALAGVLVALMYRRVREVNRQLASSHATLQVQSQRDPLTGLANRRCLHDRAAGAAAVRGALLLVDIDHFKRINDSQGHASGDAVLVEVARRLATVVRAEDLVVRWGGEEFLIYAPSLDAAATQALAARVLRAVGGQAVVLPQRGETAAGGIAVAASVGYACFPLPPQGLPLPLDRAINLADMALYTAKNQGRNRAVGVARVQAADDAALRSVEADFDSAWRAGLLELDVMCGPAAPATAAAPALLGAPGAPAGPGVRTAETSSAPAA
jgi:diguanylate cyclase (GGDEF)-like protein